MEIAKQVFDMLPEDGDKLSEKELKALTGLNLGQIKEAKKFLKENGLTNAYRGRGGYVSRIEDAKFPEEPDTMSKAEKIAGARAEKKAISAEINRRKEMRDKVISYGWRKFPEADEIQADWQGFDIFYLWVWKDKRADGYKCFAEDI
jgi:DNA-binding GntR family transcriptional regulator